MPRTKNHDLPKPDNLGRIRPHVGKLANDRKARFQVGDSKTSKAESIRRLGLLRSLYEAQCERFNVDYWCGWTHQVALKIAAGQSVIDTCIGDAENPRHLAGIVAQLHAWGTRYAARRSAFKVLCRHSKYLPSARKTRY